eukprot:CAMPEP_0172018546 /NCGR_PEP_ID=MMETSP1041-20130122/12158_1 /TAXON_ID=464988 /ORGANISM="Hemiselmis andersenii, Strain CCMP439" /LENGTH=93 /DNA_ID=CAMNT_0012673655 /DNA_START=34 /DNA_END=315 /DNA_ORIENTATION=+
MSEHKSTDIASIMSWLPAVEGSASTSMQLDLGSASNGEESAEDVKRYLAQEAVPVLTKCLMDLCMEKERPGKGKTIPWLIECLQKQQSAEGKQ